VHTFSRGEVLWTFLDGPALEREARLFTRAAERLELSSGRHMAEPLFERAREFSAMASAVA
jgi:hypothetical protein